MSSILETFLILFDSDSAEVKKGATDAKKTADDLNKSLSTTDKVSAKVGASFKNMIGAASGALLALLSAGAIIGGIKAAAAYSDRLGELSDALGVNVEELSVWGDAVKKNGGTVEGFQATVASMTAGLNAFATKGTSLAAPFFQQLGIRMVDARGKARNFLDLLPELANKFEKLGKSQAFGIGQKMGLDQGTIMLLQKGQKEVEAVIKRQKELGVVTKEDAEISAKFNDQLDDTAHAFRSIFVRIGSEVLPAITAVFKFFERGAVFFRKHSDLIVGGLIAIGATIAYFVAPAVGSLLTLAAPFILIGAAVIAVGAIFALVFEDIMHFYRGQDSLLGDLIKKWPLLGKAVRIIELAVKQLAGVFKFLSNTVLDAWSVILNTIISAGKGILEVFDKIAGAYNKAKSFFSFPKNESELLATAQIALTQAGNSPIASQTSNSILNSSTKNATKNTTVQIDSVNVQTQATDADGIAGAIGASMTTQMEQAVSNFDDGRLA